MQHGATDGRLSTRRRPGHTVIAIHGELDIATTAALRSRILTVLKDTTTPVIIDLSDVSFCDASGLALLVGTQRRARLHGATVVLAAPRPSVRKLLRITGLGRTFTIRPTLVAAQLGCSPNRSARHGTTSHPVGDCDVPSGGDAVRRTPITVAHAPVRDRRR